MRNENRAALAIHEKAVAPLPHVEGDLGAAVDGLLAEFVAAETARLCALDPALEPLAVAARDAVLGGGKRLRPTFAYWGWRGVVGPDAPAGPVLPALAGLELLHAFALVHDDVMDDSTTRRGRPTAHRALAARHAEIELRGDAEGFGRSGAILVGDLCLVWADQMIALAGLPAEAVAAARRNYDRMRIEAIAGQFLDVLGEQSRRWSVERALLVARLKTASYTVIRPLRYGAALGDPAGRPPRGPLARAYTRYGLAVGEAFQLRDDLLGGYGDPAVTGKPAGEDLARGKPTTLLELARQRATGSQRADLERLLARGDVARLRDLLQELGATAQVGHMITKRVADALGAVADMPVDPGTRAALADLAVTATKRSA